MCPLGDGGEEGGGAAVAVMYYSRVPRWITEKLVGWGPEGEVAPLCAFHFVHHGTCMVIRSDNWTYIGLTYYTSAHILLHYSSTLNNPHALSSLQSLINPLPFFLRHPTIAGPNTIYTHTHMQAVQSVFHTPDRSSLQLVHDKKK